MNITQLYVKATDFEPYDFQRRVAENGLPELLRIPTGCGKTEAVGLGWLYRRRFHDSAEVRSATPHWLVIALPMRTLVEQTYSRFQDWLERLGLNDEVGLHMVRGGVNWSDRDWRLSPNRDAVFIGTIDMLLSRALNRGYADYRWHWPMSFGAFNNGTHWVFDEIQLMDVATPNTRQLQSFRDILGTTLPTASTWMSATVDEHLLRTVDRPDIGSTVELSDHDISGSLSQRLEAVRTVQQIELPDKKPEQALAAKLIDYHRPGTLTLAVLNTVDRATGTWKSLKKLNPEAEVVLLHSRYRSADREAHTKAALAPPGPDGKMVVSTQVLEAGIDLSATVLFTEAAPWPSIVQRAGRCNRDGTEHDTQLLWAAPPKSPPYEDTDIQASVEALKALSGTPVTTTQLQTRDVDISRRITPVIRRKDIIELFDTTPDLSGNDIDVARFIRDVNDRTAHVAWRDIVEDQPKGDFSLHQDEICNVPIVKLKTWLRRNDAWRLDHLSRDSDRPWVRCSANDLHDGIKIVLDASKGGYDPEIGWQSRKGRVEVITPPLKASRDSFSPDKDVVVGDDPISLADDWYPLAAHLVDVARECSTLLKAFGSSDLSADMCKAAVAAGRFHDIGKASSIWQDAALKTADEDQKASLRAGGPYAKTDNRRPLRYERRYFRHELASALALMNEGASTLDGYGEIDLVIYLVASHHGRVRLSIRRLPEEESVAEDASTSGTTFSGSEGKQHMVNSSDVTTGLGTTLGIAPRDKLPAVTVDGLVVPASHLTIPTGNDRYERRALALRDRADLGPFRLAFLEMIVRCADWRASRSLGVTA